MAVDGNVSASTQNVAFRVLLKLWTLSLERPLGQIDAIHAVRDRQVSAVLAAVDVSGVGGRSRFWRNGLRGSRVSGVGGRSRFWRNGLQGSRVSEVMRLRVKNIELANGCIDVPCGKGGQRWHVPKPEAVADALRRWVDCRMVLHRHDVEQGIASVWLPEALSRKYPAAHYDRKWQYVFASGKLSWVPRTGKLHRHYTHVETVPRRLRPLASAAGVESYVTRAVAKMFVLGGSRYRADPSSSASRVRSTMADSQTPPRT